MEPSLCAKSLKKRGRSAGGRVTERSSRFAILMLEKTMAADSVDGVSTSMFVRPPFADA